MTRLSAPLFGAMVSPMSARFRESNSVPSIVYIVIVQATHRLAEGAIARIVFEQQIRRIEEEELEPMGLTLLMRDLPGGRTRFLIKEVDGISPRDDGFWSDGILDRETSEAVSPVAP